MRLDLAANPLDRHLSSPQMTAIVMVEGEMPRNLTPKQDFSALLKGHLLRGTRPGTDVGEPWTYAAFAAEVQTTRQSPTQSSVSERTVSNWCNVENPRLPMAITPILRALFGNGDRHLTEREELRNAFALARSLSGNTFNKLRNKQHQILLDSTEYEKPNCRQQIVEEIGSTIILIEKCLKGSSELTECLAERLALGEITHRTAREIAENFISMGPREAFRILKWARRECFRTGCEAGAFRAIKLVAQDIALLIYGPEKIAEFRRLLQSDAPTLVTAPANNLTFAEIVMAKVEQRSLRLGPWDGRNWPAGVNLIPVPQESGPDRYDLFIKEFDSIVFQRVLSAEEMDWADIDAKRRRANLIIAGRFPEIDGVLYFVVNQGKNIHIEKEMDQVIAKLMSLWPSVVFFKLNRNRNFDESESNILRNVLELLPEDEI